MRADLRKHCTTRRSCRPACHLPGRTGSARARHEDTWLRSASVSGPQVARLRMARGAGRWPVPASRPSKSCCDQSDRCGVAGSLLVSASLCCGYCMSAPPRVPRTVTSKRTGGRQSGQPARRGFRSYLPVQQQPGVGRWLSVGRACAGTVDRRRRERSGDVRSHGNASDVLDF